MQGLKAWHRNRICRTPYGVLRKVIWVSALNPEVHVAILPGVQIRTRQASDPGIPVVTQSRNIALTS